MLGDEGSELGRIRARDLFKHHAGLDQDEEGHGGDIVGIGDVGVLLGIDGDEEGFIGRRLFG